MAGKRDLRSRLASFLELPGDVMMDVARISLVGDVELLIENHRGLAEYQHDRVVLGVPRGKVAITGDELSISSISPDRVLILGKIRSVSYLE